MTEWIAKERQSIRTFPALVLILLAACTYPTPTAQAPAMTVTATPFAPQTEVAATALPSVTPSAAPTVEVVCEVPAEGSGLPRYARLMHDSQWMPWPSRIADPDWPRGFSLDWYPETVPLWINPRSGDGKVVYPREWLEYLRALQPDDETAEWIAAIAAGLFNGGNEFIPILDLDQMEEEPRAEGISSGGNVVKVLEIKNGSARLEMLYVNDDPPDTLDINYQDIPWLVTKFTSVSREGELGNAGGINVYFPNLANRRCGYWVDMQRVELFPQLSQHATVKRSISRFDEPAASGRVIGGLGVGQDVTIHEYLPQGSDVWGRTDSGWILLLYQIQGQPIYTTSWSMETRPPIFIP